MFNRFNMAGMLAIIMWSITIAFARSLTEKLGPLTTAMIIYASGGIIGCIPYFFKHHSSKTKGYDARYLYGCGILFVTYMLTFFLALDKVNLRADVLIVVLINYLWIPFTIVLSVYITGKTLKISLIIGLFIATVGVILSMLETISIEEILLKESIQSNFYPYTLALVAAISWALYSVLAKKYGEGNDGAVPIFMLATGIFLAIMLMFVEETQTWTTNVIIELIFMTLVTNLGYVLWDFSMRKGDIHIIIPISYSTPLLSTLTSIYYLELQPGFQVLIGAILVIIGAFICYLSMNNKNICKLLS